MSFLPQGRGDFPGGLSCSPGKEHRSCGDWFWDACNGEGFCGRLRFYSSALRGPTGKLYQALDLKRGLKYVVTSGTLAAAKAARGEGIQQGKTAGDILQLGGAFFISSKEGVIWEHREAFAGDLARTDELLAAVAAAQ